MTEEATSAHFIETTEYQTASGNVLHFVAIKYALDTFKYHINFLICSIITIQVSIFTCVSTN